MNYPEDPPRWPMRTHNGVYCVRWRYRHWQRSPDGYHRWSSRWFTNISAAQRLSDQLRDAGAIVHRDLYRCEFLVRIDINNREVYGPGELEVEK